MIFYFDLLMIDNNSLLNQPQSQRRRRLHDLITYRNGYAEIVQSQNIACSRRNAAAKLREVFAQCILDRSEGIVLKPDTPYFDFSTALKPYACCHIKLKMAYIQGWGDVGDFAVVGAGYDAAKAKTYKVPNLKWTSFYIGCLENRNQVRAGNEVPRFVVVSIVETNETLMKTFRTHCNPQTMPYAEQDRFQLELHGAARARPPLVVFDDPVVFDVRCFSFDREPNTNFWSMRFPMVSRIHFDRSYMDAITFEELQEAAAEATEAPQLEDSQDLKGWIQALKKADPRGIAVDAVSQATSSSSFSSSSSSDAPQTGSLGRGNVQGHTSEGSLDTVEEIEAAAPVSDYPSLAQDNDVFPTPPSSAASQVLAGAQSAAGAETEEPRPAKRPRDSEDDKDSKKRTRCGSEMKSPSAPHNDRVNTAPSPTQPRQPLSQIDQNATPTQRPSSDDTTTVSASPVTSTSSSDVAIRQECEPAHAATRPEASVPRCSLAGHECALANKSILLSPCIAGYAWVADTLLGMHGITEFLVDPTSWKQQQRPQPGSQNSSSVNARETAHTAPSSLTSYISPPESSSGSEKIPAGRRGKRSSQRRPRKICLVESRRAQATRDFLDRIEAAGLRTRGGAGNHREWIAVYDWRVLEKITDRETLLGQDAWRGDQGQGQGKGKDEEGEDVREGSGGYDPWRQYYVGIT